MQLEDALSVYEGSPWDGATDWKDFCKSTPGNALTGLFHETLPPDLSP